MALKATAKAPGGGGNFPIPDAGNQPAVLVAIVDLGTHPTEFKDQKTGKLVNYDSHKIQLVWELTTQEKSEKENHVIGREYTLSISSNSNLGQLVSSLTGKTFSEGEEFDITSLLGKSCLISIVHGTSQKGNVYAKIGSVSALPTRKGKDGKLVPIVDVPPPKHKPVLWEIDGNDKLPEHLHDWLPYLPGVPPESPLERIRSSKEWKEKLASGGADEGAVDELADDSGDGSGDEIAF